LTGHNGQRRRDRILAAAERLFSEAGIDGVSMREIAAEAGVQLALINYYFGTKLELYRAVFRRRIEPVSKQRLEMLQRILERKKPKATIEDVFDALARPWVELRDTRGGLLYTRLIAREVSDLRESSRGIVKELLDPVARQFIAAMEKVLPGLPRAEIHRGYHFFIGALLLILMSPERTERLSGRLFDLSDSKKVVNEIVSFFSRALRKAPTGRRRTAGRKGR
jgi:AcrR family transcriptional regulator